MPSSEWLFNLFSCLTISIKELQTMGTKSATRSLAYMIKYNGTHRQIQTHPHKQKHTDINTDSIC